MILFTEDFYKKAGLKDFAPIDEVKKAHKKVIPTDNPKKDKDVGLEDTEDFFSTFLRFKDRYDEWLKMRITPAGFFKGRSGLCSVWRATAKGVLS